MGRRSSTWIPTWTALPAPTPAPVNPIDQQRRNYILILVRALEKHLDETGELDEKMADHIELLMHKFWPDEVPAPPGVDSVDGRQPSEGSDA
jgi:hypothetical protein